MTFDKFIWSLLPQAVQALFPTQEELAGRLAARVRQGSTHVTALVRDDEAARPCFRHYDNESSARLKGTFERVSLEQAWVNCGLHAVVKRGTPLQQELARAANPTDVECVGIDSD